MDARDALNIWLTHPAFDEETKLELRRIADDEKEVLSRFGRDLTFGTGGLRGLLGAGTDRMNRYTVARATQGLADYLKSLGKERIAIAYDSRHCSKSFAHIAAGVLAKNGLKVFCYNRLMPTPMLSFAVRELSCDAGIMITASHNPAQYNGYKVYGADGCQITNDTAADITLRIQEVAYPDVSWMEETDARAAGLFEDIPDAIYGAFLEKTLSSRVGPPSYRSAIRIVYTPLHGAGLEPVRDILRRMGVPFVEVTKQCVPDGNFPTCPRPNPELPGALQPAIETAKREGAELVMATDPDCDRLGVAARDAHGEYCIMTGNEIGLLLMDYLLGCRKEADTLPEEPLILKTIVTSDLCFPIAQRYAAEVREVLTGFKYIGEEIGRLESVGQSCRYVLGFEESCGYLVGTHVRDKDAVMACMLVADMAQHYADMGMTLPDVLEALYAEYGYMQNTLLSVDIVDALPIDQMRAIMAALRADPPQTLNGDSVAVVRDYLKGVDGLPESDVLAFENNRGDKAIVRPSGTEPKIKIYLSARGNSRADVRAKLTVMARQVEEWMER